MEHADLAFAMQVEARTEARRPPEAIARAQGLGVQVAGRNVETLEIVERKHLVGRQGSAERQEQRGRATCDESSHVKGAALG